MGAIRLATLDDIPDLLAIEERCFETDRLSRRNFRHMLTRGHAITLVYMPPEGTPGPAIVAYAMILLKRGTSLGRLYSFAVNPDWRGKGIGHRLLQAVERATAQEGAVFLRLEVRQDNQAAIQLYHKAGYRVFGRYDHYYEDDTDALRMEKSVVEMPKDHLAPIPYLSQSLNFTCGPACIMMALAAIKPDYRPDRSEELHIWREATTIFMTRGHGGCSAYGLALAAHKRGVRVALHVHDPDIMFIDTVRDPDKKEVIRLVQEDFLAAIAEQKIPLSQESLDLDGLASCLAQGAVVIILISTYALDREKTPHWVVVVGMDDHFVYVHDPFVDHDEDHTATDHMAMPIPREDFNRMSRYGKSRQKAAIILYKNDCA